MQRQAAQNRHENALSTCRDPLEIRRIEWPEIPPETPYLASCRNRAVCEDWMVAAPGLELGPDD